LLGIGGHVDGLLLQGQFLRPEGEGGAVLVRSDQVHHSRRPDMGGGFGVGAVADAKEAGDPSAGAAEFSERLCVEPVFGSGDGGTVGLLDGFDLAVLPLVFDVFDESTGSEAVDFKEFGLNSLNGVISSELFKGLSTITPSESRINAESFGNSAIGVPLSA
jgi:hypothetical protein